MPTVHAVVFITLFSIDPIVCKTTLTNLTPELQHSVYTSDCYHEMTVNKIVSFIPVRYLRYARSVWHDSLAADKLHINMFKHGLMPAKTII